MRKARFFLPALLFCCSYVQAQDKVTLSQNGLETTMSNGIISLIVGTNGRINTLTVGDSENLTDSEGRFTIPKVRKGSYALRAYATAGDVTDELQVKDITIDNDQCSMVNGQCSMDLGTIDWTPTRYETLLWQIGKHDRLCEEFRLGEGLRAYGLWRQVPATLTYRANENDNENENTWWYAQTQKGTWTILFDCDKTYEGDVHLTASIAGASRTPSIKVAVNGTDKSTWQFPTNDAGIYIWRQANRSGKFIKR